MFTEIVGKIVFKSIEDADKARKLLVDGAYVKRGGGKLSEEKQPLKREAR